MLFCSYDSAGAETTRILLRYEMGNQITRSGFVVLSDGTVMRQESLMGQTTFLEDEKLSPFEVQLLIAQIDTVAQFELLTVEGIDAALGGPFGEATIYTSDGYSALLYTLVGTGNMKKTLICVPGAEADVLREYIQSHVRDQMPLDTSPCK